MIEHIEDPLATALVSWLSAEDGGRRSGPPTAPVYAATCVFPLGDDAEVQPGWPASATQLSVLIEEIAVNSDGSRLCKVDFLVRELASPFVTSGADMLVMEGPKVVARAVIQDVFHDV